MQPLPLFRTSRATDLAKTVWRKSIHSQGTGGECVELANLADSVAVRDSKDPAGPKLTFTRAEVKAFFTAIRQGDCEQDRSPAC
ncbi:DUF397 domain-containing protein [Actinomadura vinacea]|uniref:DUF397 domain-containing protein n=1 Tax=Actinomadura vinacea TaxID=115336 RepID=A0ABP5W763_9ACTN